MAQIAQIEFIDALRVVISPHQLKAGPNAWVLAARLRECVETFLETYPDPEIQATLGDATIANAD